MQNSALCEIPSEHAELTPLFDEPTALFAQSATALAVYTASLRELGAARAEPTASFAQSAAAPAVYTASLRDLGAAHAEPCIAPGGFTTACALIFAYDALIFAYDVVRGGAHRVLSTVLARS